MELSDIHDEFKQPLHSPKQHYYQQEKDFSTIDFLIDAHRLRISRSRFLQACGFISGLFYRLQGWIVIFLVGMSTALHSAFIHDVIDWLIDVKDGICSHGILINHRQCCIDQDKTCSAWLSWSSLVFGSDVWIIDYLVYVGLALGLSGLSAWFVQIYSKRSAGSGISEVQTILGGFILKQVLGAWVLLIKGIGIILAQSSGLVLGSRGPLVHIACCWGNVLARRFSKYQHEGKKRELLSVSAAAGVAVAFGAPIGGVLFSLEALSTYFPHKTMWRSFFCAVISVLTLKSVYSFPSGKFVPFQITYQHEYLWFELPAFLIIGVIGGALGALFIHLNLRIQLIRENLLSLHPIKEVCSIAVFTALISYTSIFLKSSASEMLQSLFEVCSNLDPRTTLNEHLCDQENDVYIGCMLIVVALVKYILLMVTFGIKVPTGIFMPSLVIGACLGRAIGIFMIRIQSVYQDSWVFSDCDPHSQCIYPGVYAIVGAAAFLGGITRMTISLAVTMLELTGSLVYVVPIVISVMASKWTGDFLGYPHGIFAVVTALKKYPYLPDDATADTDTVVEQLMSRNPVSLDSKKETLHSLQVVLEQYNFSGFPVVEQIERDQIHVVGYLSRADLYRAMDISILQGYSLSTLVSFTKDVLIIDSIDYSTLVNDHPITIEQTVPLDILVDMFKGLGLRQAMIVSPNGNLVGIIKKKDLVNYTNSNHKLNDIIHNHYQYFRVQ